MIKLCVLLLAGGLAAQHSTLPVQSNLLDVILLASFCGLFHRRARPAAMAALGFATFHMAGQDVIDHRIESRFEGDSMLAVVRIADFPTGKRDSISLIVEPVNDPRLPQRSRVSWFEAPVVPTIGEIWELEVRLRRPRGGVNPGVFDVETWLFREKFHATGYVVNGKRNRLLWGGTESSLDALRARFETRARAATDSRDAAAVLMAVGTGSRHGISPAQWDRFAISGTSHLMAISGLHVGLAGMVALGIAWGIAGLLPLRGGHLLPAFATSLLAAAAYTGVSGFGVPALRAVLMLAVALLAVMRRRQPAAFEAVAVAATVIFLVDPLAALSPGFWLSFAAVVVLLWLARRRQLKASGMGKSPVRLFELQVFLMFGLLPLTALFFQRFAIVATPVNMLAVPAFSVVVVPLTLAGLVVGEICESAATPLLRLAAVVIDALDVTIRRFSEVPFADLTLARFEGLASTLLLLPLAWVLLPRGWPGRGVACVGVVGIVLWRPAPPPADCFDTWVLDVGQGLAVVIETHDHVLLYDTGMAWRGGGSVAERVIEPFLAARGIGRIDGLVISHDDLDHSGGAARLRHTMKPRFLLAGEPLRQVPNRPCEAGATWWSGAVRFLILHPEKGRPGDGNNASCVIRVSIGPYSVLLTGDIEAPAEGQVLRRGLAVGADVVLIPHHGSATSSSVPFVDAVSPIIAVVSAAHANRWGFPSDHVVNRWEAVGARVLNTAQHGTVRLRLCAEGGIAATNLERKRHRRFWHAD